ncbi:FCRL5 protein, partial [Crocuta crocuta]
LTARPSQPVEGSSVTLTCNTRVPLGNLDVSLQFRFFRNGQVLWPGWSSSAELQLPTVWREDTGSYWCEGKTTASRVTRSSRVQIQVQIPVCNVSLETQPPGGQVQKGQRLALVCEVATGTGDITFLWYKGALGLSLETKTQRSLAAKFEIAAVGDSDTGKYYCAADNGYGPSLSELVSVTVRIPVSRPVLTVRAPGAQAEEGDMVELRCEAQSGSPPILYRFYHKNITLGRSSAHAGGGASFNLSLTAEHSGNYSCEADNGLGARRSEAVPLSVTGVPVSNVSLEMRPPRGEVVEGGNLVLLCSVAEGTGDITFSWHREATGTSVGRKIQRSLSAELEVPAVQENDAGRYYCRADNGHGPAQSKVLSVLVRIPVSCPVLTVRAPRDLAVEGDMVELQCEAQKGSPPILYWFYHEDNALGNSSAPFGGEASFNLSVTAEHSGNYSCEADNGLGAQRSEAVPLSISVPVSRPVLTVRMPWAQAVEGHVVELLCEAQRGSPPILYRFYHEGDALGNSLAPSGGGASFNLSLTAEHSGNYSCEANNSLGVQRSEVVSLSIMVPVSRPVFTLNPAVAQIMVGDVLELRCEVQRGSPPILYWFYHEDVILENTSAPFGGGASFNLSLTTEHSGNYSCGADNGLGAQRSEAVSLNVTG